MNIDKKSLGPMVRCYCTSSVTIDGELFILLAGEDIDSHCYAYHGKDFSQRETVWDTVGGTMSIIEIPDTNGQFLAVQHFYPGFNSKEAKIVWGRRESECNWIIKEVLALPYVHRFDIFKKNNILYFLGSVLCNSKTERNDWSDPGKVYVGILPEDLNQGIQVKPLVEQLNKNHGYCRATIDGIDHGFVTYENGILCITPPNEKDGEWKTEKILEGAIGDVAFVDIDNCGEMEMATIEPFHGSKINIYKRIDGEYRIVYSYPKEVEFAHAIWGGMLRGKPSFVCGVRRGDSDLFCIQCSETDNLAYTVTLIERGVGPSNVAVVNEEKRDIIISANHTKNEAALYFITD